MRRAAVGVVCILIALATSAPASFAASDPRSQWPVGETVVDDSPLGPRRSPAIAVRGARVYVIGGEKIHPGGYPFRRMNDGAVFDLRTREWSRLPDAPFKRTSISSAQWVGRNMIVAGVTCPGAVGDEHGCTGGRSVAAVYSPGTKSWRSLKVPARYPTGFGSRFDSLMTTRSEAWFLDGGTQTVAVNLRAERWRSIPPPLIGREGAICAAKHYGAVIGSINAMGPIGLRILTAESDDWGPLVDSKGFQEPLISGFVSCTEDSVVVVRSERGPVATACPTGTGCTPAQLQGPLSMRVLRYDLAAKQWSVIPPPATMHPGLMGFGHAEYVDFLAKTGPGLRLTTATGAWTPIATGANFQYYPSEVLWTRGLAVTHDRDALVVYRPL